jgi:hypothetical protein
MDEFDSNKNVLWNPIRAEADCHYSDALALNASMAHSWPAKTGQRGSTDSFTYPFLDRSSSIDIFRSQHGDVIADLDLLTT